MRSNDADVIRKDNPMYEDGYDLEAEDDGATRVSTPSSDASSPSSRATR